MTVAELKYLIAVKELIDTSVENSVKLTDIAIKMSVSKVSVYRAMDRLEKSGYVTRDDKGKILLLDYGENQVIKYKILAEYITKHLENYCDVTNDIAYNDAIAVACALSEESITGVKKYLS